MTAPKPPTPPGAPKGQPSAPSPIAPQDTPGGQKYPGFHRPSAQSQVNVPLPKVSDPHPPPPIPGKPPKDTGRINPDIRIDTSTTTTSDTTNNEPTIDDEGNVQWPKGRPNPGQPDPRSNVADVPNHYDVGHAVGSALGAHIQAQILAEIQSWFQ